MLKAENIIWYKHILDICDNDSLHNCSYDCSLLKSHHAPLWLFISGSLARLSHTSSVGLRSHSHNSSNSNLSSSWGGNQSSLLWPVHVDPVCHQTQQRTITNLDSSRQTNCTVEGEMISLLLFLLEAAHTCVHTLAHTLLRCCLSWQHFQSLLAYHSLTQMNNVAAAAAAERKGSTEKRFSSNKMGCSRMSHM